MNQVCKKPLFSADKFSSLIKRNSLFSEILSAVENKKFYWKLNTLEMLTPHKKRRKNATTHYKQCFRERNGKELSFARLGVVEQHWTG